MNTPITTTSFVIVEAVLAIGLLPMIWNISLLAKFDLEGKSCSELRHLVLQYKKAYHQETLLGIALVCVAMVAFYISELGFNPAAKGAIGIRLLLPIGLSLLTFGFGYLMAIWQRRRHAQQMQEIERGLEELREFEES